MGQCCNPIFDVTIHAFDTSSVVRLRSSSNLTPDRIFVLPFPVTLTTLTLNQRSSRRFGNYFWKSSPEGPPPSFLQLRAKPSCSHGTPPPCVRLRTGRFIAIINNGTSPIVLQSRLNLAILASRYLKRFVPPWFSLGDNIPLNSYLN